MQQTTHEYSAAAAQLAEAACRARDGDRETAQACIALAMALLGGHPGAVPVLVNPGRPPELPAKRAALALWQIRRIAIHVDAHLAGRIAIDDLAAIMNFSKSHFCRAFKATLGVTAHTWVMLRRVERAQALLLTTNATLSDIALSCGMSDQSHFTRTFRRLVGATPHFWRRSRRDALDDSRIAPGQGLLPRVPVAKESVAAAASAAL